MNGWWNPEGTGAYRLLQCAITGGVLDGKPVPDDPAIGMLISGSNDRVCGKLVDLDPQQQSVSEIWGLQVRLGDNENPRIFDGDYAVAAFIDLWQRQQSSVPGDQALAAAYQSVIENVVWQDNNESPLLCALRAASDEGLLSIAFNIFSFNLAASNPEFTLGRIVGTIGPALATEPRSFVAGRQMMPTLSAGPTVPDNHVYFFQGEVNLECNCCSFDFGHCLPIIDSNGDFENLGSLYMAVLKTDADNGDVLSADNVALLGPLPYLEKGWYQQTAGVQDFNYEDDCWIVDNIAQRPLALLQETGTGEYLVLVRESLEGLYVRPDRYVCRLNPSETTTLDFYATRYGQRLAGATLITGVNNSMIGGGGSGRPLQPPVEIPTVGIPENAISYANSLTTDNNGKTTLSISADAAGPGNPRGYVDGQLYGIGYQLADQPANYHSNLWNVISVLAWDAIETPVHPTWYQHIQPIMQQYGNLYPIMSKHLVDLGNYDHVVAHLSILELAFALPVADPNYMPVTRDLSTAKREMLLFWIRNPGPDGLPLKGQAPPSPRLASVAVEEPPEAEEGEPTVPHAGGKTSFIQNLPSMNK